VHPAPQTDTMMTEFDHDKRPQLLRLSVRNLKIKICKMSACHDQWVQSYKSSPTGEKKRQITKNMREEVIGSETSTVQLLLN